MERRIMSNQRSTTMRSRSAVLAVLLAMPLLTGGTWDSIKKGASQAGGAVTDGAGKVGGAATDTWDDVTTKETAAETRVELDRIAGQSRARLFRDNPGAKKLDEIAYGYAVFDTRKMSLLITTGFGGGVAVAKPSGARTYMKMASGGVNLGAGGALYQLVFLFEDEPSFRRFVDDGWEAGGEANATFGDDTLAATPRFIQGMAVYQMTEAGVMLAIDVTGTKYWKDKELNAP